MPSPQIYDAWDVDYSVPDTFNVGDNGVVTNNQAFFVGDYRRFQVKDFTLDGASWAITGATLTLVDPDGASSPYSASQVDSTCWAYDALSGELDSAGVWRRFWTLTDGSISLSYEDFSFTVRGVA